MNTNNQTISNKLDEAIKELKKQVDLFEANVNRIIQGNENIKQASERKRAEHPRETV